MWSNTVEHRDKHSTNFDRYLTPVTINLIENRCTCVITLQKGTWQWYTFSLYKAHCFTRLTVDTLHELFSQGSALSRKVCNSFILGTEDWVL